MGSKRDVTTSCATVLFRFADGSTVRSRCTACKEVIENAGGLYTSEGLYDLDVLKRIPDEYLELDCSVFSEDEEVIDTRQTIDIFVEEYIKNTW